MSPKIHVCKACCRAHYPAPLLCFGCGAAAFTKVAATVAKVIETTDVVYQVGSDAGETVILALVETLQGPQLIVRLANDARRMDDVLLELSGMALTGRTSPSTPDRR